MRVQLPELEKKLNSYTACTETHKIRTAIKDELETNWEPAKPFPKISKENYFFLNLSQKAPYSNSFEDMTGLQSGSTQGILKECEQQLKNILLKKENEILSPDSLLEDDLAPCLYILLPFQITPISLWDTTHETNGNLQVFKNQGREKIESLYKNIADLLFRYFGDSNINQYMPSLSLIGQIAEIITHAEDIKSPDQYIQSMIDEFLKAHPYRLHFLSASALIQFGENKEKTLENQNVMNYIQDYRSVFGYEFEMSSIISGFYHLYKRGHYHRRYQSEAWNRFATNINQVIEDPYISIFHKLDAEALAYGIEHDFESNNRQILMNLSSYSLTN